MPSNLPRPRDPPLSFAERVEQAIVVGLVTLYILVFITMIQGIPFQGMFYIYLVLATLSTCVYFVIPAIRELSK